VLRFLPRSRAALDFGISLPRQGCAMSDFHVLVSDGFAPRVDIAGAVTSDPAQTTLTTEQLMTAMGLVDEILDCDARLHAYLDGPQRPQLESALADRTEKLTAFLDSAVCASQHLQTL
jgi:hypothetical protein